MSKPAMAPDLSPDSFPGRPKILFVGLAHSTHTHSWIDLLEDSEFNVRLFGLPSGVPPLGWPVRTYVTADAAEHEPGDHRTYLRYPGRAHRAVRIALRSYEQPDALQSRWLREIVRSWKPDIVHTLGLDPAGYFYHEARQRERGGDEPLWVLQLRGGSDLTLAHLDPEIRPRVAQTLSAADRVMSDNNQNYVIGRSLGLREQQIASLGVVPGTGGVPVDELAARWEGTTSQRRVVVWPKAYECPWSKALPVLEALRHCWDELQPCELHMLAADQEARMWYWTLPERVRSGCRLGQRIPREQMLTLMARARVLLAPSLVDGTPNSLFEAMASGALPILSPLDTIRSIVTEGTNVLFARNLYPPEIASALRTAMSDDAFVDRVAHNNLAAVRELADRAVIRHRVLAYYEGLVA